MQRCGTTPRRTNLGNQAVAVGMFLAVYRGMTPFILAVLTVALYAVFTGDDNDG